MTVLGDRDEELDPGEWWVVSLGSNGEGAKEGKKRKKRRREKEGGTFQVPGGLLLRTREEAEANVQAQCMTWRFAYFGVSWVVHGGPRLQLPCSSRDVTEVRRGQGHMHASLNQNIDQQHGMGDQAGRGAGDGG